MDNQLIHAGIKGMRWGHRRYQNKDGSLTPEGKKRYGDKNGEPTHEDYIKATSKSIREMSDTELNNALTRLQREKTYMTLLKESNDTVGKKVVNKVITKIGDKALEVAANRLGERVFTDLFNAIIDIGMAVVPNASTNQNNP